MKQNRGSRGSTQGPPETQTSKRKTQQEHNRTTRPSGNQTGGGRREGRGGQGGEGCTNHIRIAIVQLSGV